MAYALRLFVIVQCDACVESKIISLQLLLWERGKAVEAVERGWFILGQHPSRGENLVVHFIEKCSKAG